MVKILVIDDEPSIRANIVATLELEDWDAIAAENGLAGLALAREQTPDLILCDIMMPVMDGYRVLLELRSNPATSLIPLIFLSAKSDRESVRYGIELGADDYLGKPFTPKELIAGIKTRLERQKLIERQYAERLDNALGSVLYTLPHELRTPLTGILGLAELLSLDGETMDRSDIIEVAQTILRSGKRLERLVENLLLYAQLEMILHDQNRIDARRKSQCLNAASVVKTIAWQQARQAERETDLILDLAMVETVRVAQDSLEKITLELIDNALKFSDPGTPILIEGLVGDSSYVLTVNDKGVGMSPDEIARIGAYVQFERRLHEQQGTGLGLALVKLLVELYDGTVSIDSVPMQGTSVNVALTVS